MFIEDQKDNMPSERSPRASTALRFVRESLCGRMQPIPLPPPLLQKTRRQLRTSI